MFSRFLCGVATVILFASPVCAQPAGPGPAGHWEGSFTAQNNSQIKVALDLAQNARSEWIASMGVPSENATGLVVNDVVVNGTSVKFVAVELMMARFDLTLSAGGTLKGTISTLQASIPIEFTRTGEAHVQLIAQSPAVSKELEGDWEGSLAMGTQAFRIVVHFRNQPDKTVAATLDSLDRAAMGVPLNDVRQAGQKVEFGVKVALSSFQGTLNKEGTELSGEWTHEDGKVPFTLRKR